MTDEPKMDRAAMALKIFLAHAREDKPQVRRLHADLRSRGLDPWLDEIDLVPGQIWTEEIPKAIRQAGVFLACLSSRSVGKVGYVQNEFRLALSAFGERPPGSIFLIPVRLDDCNIPDLQMPDRGLSLKDIHWVDLWSEGGFDRLVKAIERAQEGVANPPEAGEAASTAIPVIEHRTEVVRERIAPEAAQEQMVSAEPPRREAGVESAQRREPKRQASFLWRRTTVVAAIIGAIGVVAAAGLNSPLLDLFSSDGGQKDQEMKAVPAPIATTVASPEMGKPFRDCGDCPLMVAIPAGSFTMGSPQSEEGRSDSEGPQHEVTIPRPFALGQYEMTFDEWDACVKGGGCNAWNPGLPLNWVGGRAPVIHVSWKDAEAYVAWLSKHTGRPYRLPSEAEWEYAARANTTTRYWWGDEITSENGNYGESVGKITEVGSYPPNPWGLYDMNGNVWEWVEECWHDTYKGAPNDGSVWMAGDCNLRALRGGSWRSESKFLRSALRVRHPFGDRLADIGFRVATTLSQIESVTP